MHSDRLPRVLIFIVAYNAEQSIQQVLTRIPPSLSRCNAEILIIDDSSQDDTCRKAHEIVQRHDLPFPTTIMYNPENQGYGGNQKIGFQYAIKNDFDIVALIHGDGQYAPECLPDLLEPLLRRDADAVFGSRMMSRLSALKGGMPLYKYIGNRILTFLQNWLLCTALTEFHSGYRLYSTAALRRIPFNRNSNDFHFDTDIIIQLLRAGMRIQELPIPTYYGNEICRVNGMKYAWNVVKASLLARIQNLGILYERKFDIADPTTNNPLYQFKAGESTHSLAISRVSPGSRVADVGCAGGYVGRALGAKGCRVTGIDQFSFGRDIGLDSFIQADLAYAEFPIDAGTFDYVLLLDVLEHLPSPEKFVESLRFSRTSGNALRVIASTGNVAFITIRMGLFCGWFNYGLRGILDLTHTRLFTFRSFQKLFEQAGYNIEEVRGVPAPFRMIFPGALGKVLEKLNRALIYFSPSLFAYQIFLVCSPMPTLDWLLNKAEVGGKEKLRQLA